MASQAPEEGDLQQCCGPGVRDLAVFPHPCALCEFRWASGHSQGCGASQRDQSLFFFFNVHTCRNLFYVFVWKSAYFRDTLSHFRETGPQYSKASSFSLTLVPINLRRKKI